MSEFVTLPDYNTIISLVTTIESNYKNWYYSLRMTCKFPEKLFVDLSPNFSSDARSRHLLSVLNKEQRISLDLTKEQSENKTYVLETIEKQIESIFNNSENKGYIREYLGHSRTTDITKMLPRLIISYKRLKEFIENNNLYIVSFTIYSSPTDIGIFLYHEINGKLSPLIDIKMDAKFSNLYDLFENLLDTLKYQMSIDNKKSQRIDHV